MQNIKLGAVIHFVPAAFMGEKSGVLPGKMEIPRRVIGRIVYINEAHSFFTVEYELHGNKLRESIKF